LAPRPDVVLLDEPFSSLDAALRTQLRGDVREILRTAGTASVFVTHDQDEALTLGDRMAVMVRGHVEQVGPPEVVYGEPATPFVRSSGRPTWSAGRIARAWRYRLGPSRRPIRHRAALEVSRRVERRRGGLGWTGDAGAWRPAAAVHGTEILCEVIAADSERLWVGPGPFGSCVSDAVTLRLRDVETARSERTRAGADRRDRYAGFPRGAVQAFG
jgi:energy-coupling factor transporter ATP-binding protein EcfA2